MNDDWTRFPTDEVSLTLLEAACNINPDTGHTELGRFLDMGTVVKAVTNEDTGEKFASMEAALEAHSVYDSDGPPVFFVEHEADSEPHSEHTVIISLIEEIRRLREAAV